MLCSACFSDRKTVQYIIPGIEGKCCGSCRRRWKCQSDPTYAKEAAQRHRDGARKFRKAFPDRIKNTRLRSMYGIDLLTYQKMSASQQGACAICGGMDCKLFVDHDHKTGRVRGLLCSACNLLLGKARESEEILLRAASYLRATNDLSQR